MENLNSENLKIHFRGNIEIEYEDLAELTKIDLEQIKERFKKISTLNNNDKKTEDNKPNLQEQ